MDTRRSFIKKSTLLSGAAAVAQFLPPSVQKAFAIEPAPNSTYLDAEHIVFLMQENRSFDHTFGTLKGVRGFNDPRAITLPDQNKVWLQTNKNGETFAPFRLDIKDTKITWMGSLPHSRESQLAARNNGMHDNWLEAKKPGDKNFEHMPLTMGFYTRGDIPFYYALADSFTVCDQHFCSSLTGTTPNRSYFWNGAVRAKPDINSKAFLLNEEYDDGVQWETFPELLEANNISWKIYQNEIAADGGFKNEEEEWLGNFGDNPLENFKQYNAGLAKRHVDFLPKKIALLNEEIKELQNKIQNKNLTKSKLVKANKRLNEKQNDLKIALSDCEKYTAEKFENLSQQEKNLHLKAFTVNENDPHQHELTSLDFKDKNISREINVPKGDVFHQFRSDVQNENLPTVSWLVAPENFSDHPAAPWFGSWYVSEAMDILTQNPEIWKKTIFILTYDENDGYFDHVPPFVAPDMRNPSTGKASEGIDTNAEFTDDKRFPGTIGMGYRVPLVIASPWSRGGYVNSQVFDHTSSLQFLEKFLNEKFKKNIQSSNITKWRRTVCGDLTSVFRKATDKKNDALDFVQRDAFVESIYSAEFKNVPNNFKALTKNEIAAINQNSYSSYNMPKQETGIKPACALPYELYADGKVSTDKKSFTIKMKAGIDLFGERSHGVAFNIFSNKKNGLRSYAVAANNILEDDFLIESFENEKYHCSVYGPNGFFREFKGDKNDPAMEISTLYSNKNEEQKLIVKLKNTANEKYQVIIKDNAYNQSAKFIELNAAAQFAEMDLSKSFGWYDLLVSVKGNDIFAQHYAGHIETGKESFTDPLMGRIII